jgi:hypothetical protein
MAPAVAVIVPAGALIAPCDIIVTDEPVMALGLSGANVVKVPADVRLTKPLAEISPISSDDPMVVLFTLTLPPPAVR